MSQKLTELVTKVLPEHGTTRWNGQYTLMKCILENFEEAMLHFHFTDSDRAPLAALVKFFAPFFHTTETWEGEKLATLYNVIPERHIPASTEVPDFKNPALAALETRFGFVTHDQLYLSATVLRAHGQKWVPNAPNVALLSIFFNQ